MAFKSLTNPCLPDFFSKSYTAFPGLLAMMSALFVIGLEQVLTLRGAKHSHSHNWEYLNDDPDDVEQLPAPEPRPGLAARRGAHRRPSDLAMNDADAAQGLIAGISPLPGSTPVTASEPTKKESTGVRASNETDPDDIDLDEFDPVMEAPATKGLPVHAGQLREPDEQERKRLIQQCVLLEFGICFHSIFIGMALSVTSGPMFGVLAVAITFHQFFEGLALGTRISALHFPRSSWKPWVMILIFAAITPLGQAIGLGAHNLWDPMSEHGLIIVGLMNAISSGLLVFAGLVQLIASDFLTAESYEVLSPASRAWAYGMVLLGAILMAAIGAIA
jgi:solute carrier family 39 (zinc transporter), member 1/2/3